MLKVIPMIPSYYLFRLMGWPRKLPMNITLSISFRCNSYCKTCNIFKKSSDELTLREWQKVFHSLGKTPVWVTISGGEPFLREDLPALVKSLYDICRPSIINIPTNGLLSHRIPGYVDEIARHCSKTRIVINLSIDEIGERHDEIRGVQGNFAKVMETFTALRELRSDNLTIGFHTVISKFNVNRMPDIYGHLLSCKPDSYITEIAEERKELDTVGSNIAPSYEAYVKAVDFLTRNPKRVAFNRMGKIARAFRSEYYQRVKQILKEKRQVIPCYAGFASAQIAPDGDVWACCTRAESMGNVKRNGYDFKRVWFSKKADQLRESIKKGRCYCPLANA
ncbi:MAG: radical SAM protein, partial [Thermodesulfobacteriota bacterium]|nr:radical SAM protein [Thermodesulfobacteriota bacterium]